MAGLEAVGIPGSDALSEALTSCTDPLAAIEEFQLQNGILLPSLRPALPFLDLHGVNRLEFHNSVMEELRESLLTKIGDLANSADIPDKHKRLNDLLQKCFPVVKNKLLQPVVMGLLKHITNIRDDYLTQILEDKDLYNECAVEVKRQIWQDNKELFGEEIQPLFQQYIVEKEKLLLNHELTQHSFYSQAPKNRRQHEIVQKLVTMVGKNTRIYEMLLICLKNLYLRSRNHHYCTLRTEVLMALHDLEIHEVCNVDPCHKFAWCLDACIREKYVDSKRARELQGFLDCIKRGQEHVLGQLSLILCDPYAMHTLGMSIMKALQHSVNTEALPRDNGELIVLLRLLCLGIQAWDLVDGAVYREPKLEPPLMIKFLPGLMSLMVDESILATIAKFGPDEPVPLLTSVPDFFVSYMLHCPIASLVAMQYTLQTARQRNRAALSRTLPCLLKCENERSLEDTFLHTLVSYLIFMSDDFSHEEFCITVFDDFFMPSISKENVMRHLLRLLYHVHHKMPGKRLDNLMTIIEPGTEHSEAVHETYKVVNDKIQSYQPSPTPQPEQQLDSPLMSVPAPTPRPV
ncbi:negative elongation factor B-like [Tubulanus polymorphus]|uniref:negative elongation factor B-like n=1 Tax=Tubulanus polymorphus TaxID=672921 RepID=UPI003DA54812